MSRPAHRERRRGAAWTIPDSLHGVDVEVLPTRGKVVGEIVLMHLGTHSEDHSTLDADALPGIIPALRAKGYGFVTLGELRGSHDPAPAP